MCSTVEMIGASVLINTPKDYFAEVNNEYKKRRDIVYNALKNMPELYVKPMGAFYVVAKLPIDDAEKNFCKMDVDGFLTLIMKQL